MGNKPREEKKNNFEASKFNKHAHTHKHTHTPTVIVSPYNIGVSFFIVLIFA